MGQAAGTQALLKSSDRHVSRREIYKYQSFQEKKIEHVHVHIHVVVSQYDIPIGRSSHGSDRINTTLLICLVLMIYRQWSMLVRYDHPFPKLSIEFSHSAAL